MKPRHWFNLVLVSAISAGIAYLLLQWAVTSYAAPTCRAYAESKGLTYTSYEPAYLYQSSGQSNLGRDGDCQLVDGNGTPKTITLVTASGPQFGAPFFVSFALRPDIIFGASFFVVAFILAIITRPFQKK
ncbi:MAG: hypothetical protein ABI986_11580 [Chloroflexota bacterium]